MAAKRGKTIFKKSEVKRRKKKEKKQEKKKAKKRNEKLWYERIL
jgi:hypothetical protein